MNLIGLSTSATIVESSSPRVTSSDDARFAFFRFFWVLFYVLMVVNPGVNFGLGNTNSVERLVLFFAGLAFLYTKPIVKKNAYPLFAIVFIVILCGASTTFFGFDWGRMLASLFAFFIIFMFFMALPQLREADLMLKCMAWAPFAMVLLNVVFVILGMRSFWAVDHTGATRLGATVVTAHLAAAGMVGCIAGIFLGQIHAKRYYLLAFANFLITFLTATRMPIALSLLIAVPLIFFSLQSFGGRLAFILGGLFSSALFMLLFGKNLLTRFESGSDSGRESIWQELLSWADRYPYFGVGYGHHAFLMPENLVRLRGTVAPHSEYIRLWTEIGIVGSSVFWTSLFVLFIGLTLCFKTWSDRLLVFMSCAALCVFGITDNAFLLANGPFFVLAMVCGLTLKQSE